MGPPPRRYHNRCARSLRDAPPPPRLTRATPDRISWPEAHLVRPRPEARTPDLTAGPLSRTLRNPIDVQSDGSLPDGVRMTVCQSCQGEVPVGARFCPSCGYEFAAAPTVTAWPVPPPPSKRSAASSVTP